MKKWLVVCTLCSSLFIGNPSIHADTRQESLSAQTEVTVELARSIESGQLPGTVIGDQVSDTNNDMSVNKNLPKTNEQSQLVYSILGGILLGSVACLIMVKKKKEREVEESCTR